MSEHRSFSVWHDNQEQWDPNDIDEPALRCFAESALAAAERLADDSDSSYLDVIVRDDDAGTYWRIDLVRGGWSVKRNQATTLDALSEP